MTWGQFKEKINQLVKDDEELVYIVWDTVDEIDVSRDEEGVSIT